MRFERRLPTILGGSLSLLCLASASSAQQPSLPDEVAVQIQARIDKGYHLATVVAVVDTGRASHDDATTPDSASIFEIGSITKAFTATVLADMAMAGEVGLDDAVSRYLPPAVPELRTRGQPMTLLDLATHSSGLPREPSNMDGGGDNRYATYTFGDLYDFLSRFEPLGSDVGYLYSNVGYALLGHLLERRVGVSYERLVISRIANVLGMPDTRITLSEEQRGRLVAPFRNGLTPAELDVGVLPGMGGLRSTARDMVAFVSANLGLSASPLRSAMDFARVPRTSAAPIEDYEVGLAWEILIRPESGKTIVYHRGGTNGFVALIAFNVRAQTGVVVLISGTRFFSDLGFHLLDPTYPLADPDVNPLNATR
jgi:CubicO group peptidase (beta-lactamase class C family)